MKAPAIVLGIDDFSEPGGAQLVLLEVLSRLDRSRFEPHIVLPQRGRLSRLYDERCIPVHFIDMAGLKKNYRTLAPAWRILQQLVHLIFELDAALIHANSLWTLQFSVPAAIFAKRSLLSFVHAFPIIHNPYKRFIFRRAKSLVSSRTAKFLAVSEELSRRLQEEGIAPQGKIEVITNGVDLKRFHPEKTDPTWRTRMQLPLGVPLVGVVGRIHPGKGQGEFVRAVAELCKNTETTAHFVVIGEEFTTALENLHFTVELQRTAQRLGIHDRFHLLGFQEGEDLTAAYSQLGIVVLPSHEESFGMVLLEAMAMGKPVVASRTGGIPEIVTDGQTGLLVQVGDAEELAAAIGSLLRDDELAQAMGLRGRAKVEECFDVAVRVQTIEELYETLVP